MKENILKIYTNFKSRRKTLSFFGNNQYSDWKIVLSIFFVVFFVSITLALISYFNTRESVDLFNSSQTTVVGKKIKKETLEKVIIKIEERQKNFEALQANKPIVGDPSI